MRMVPSSVLLPSNRLEHLLRQSLCYQQAVSLYPYTQSTKLNLAEDMVLDTSKLPHLLAEITFHSDEVWACKFSPSGTWLATAGARARTLCCCRCTCVFRGCVCCMSAQTAGARRLDSTRGMRFCRCVRASDSRARNPAVIVQRIVFSRATDCVPRSVFACNGMCSVLHCMRAVSTASANDCFIIIQCRTEHRMQCRERLLHYRACRVHARNANPPIPHKCKHLKSSTHACMQTHQVKHVTCKHIMSSTHACISRGHAYVGKLTPMYHSYLVCPGMRLSLAVAMSLQRNVRMRPDIASGKDRRIAVWSTQALHTDALVKGRDREGAMHGACRGAHDASSMSDRFGAALVLSLEAGMIVCSLTWSSDESILVAAGWRDNTARAWYIPSGMQVPPLAHPACRSLPSPIRHAGPYPIRHAGPSPRPPAPANLRRRVARWALALCRRRWRRGDSPLEP
jgi:hypothetical protein